jgi:hypothetical protein
VKRLNQDGLQGETEMLRELQVLGSMQHRHLVALLGWCQAEHCLVYELAERGSLEVSNRVLVLSSLLVGKRAPIQPLQFLPLKSGQVGGLSTSHPHSLRSSSHL